MTATTQELVGPAVTEMKRQIAKALIAAELSAEAGVVGNTDALDAAHKWAHIVTVLRQVAS